MSGNTTGKLFNVTTFGESHGTAMGCIIDGCPPGCLLYTSDAADEEDSVDLGGRRIIKKKKNM